MPSMPIIVRRVVTWEFEHHSFPTRIVYMKTSPDGRLHVWGQFEEVRIDDLITAIAGALRDEERRRIREQIEEIVR